MGWIWTKGQHLFNHKLKNVFQLNTRAIDILLTDLDIFFYKII
jgi:hypothetical protein